MKLEVQIDKNSDADFAGELLLNLINPKERWGYWTDEAHPDWIECDEDDMDFSLEVRTICKGMYAKEKSEYGRIRKLTNRKLNLNVYLYWDGDGTMVFENTDENWLLYNGDCKKANEWEWVNEDSWVHNYWDEQHVGVV